MYGLAPGGERGFLDGFAQRRVPVASPGDILGGPSVFHGEDALAEQLAGKAGHVNYDVIPSIIYTHPEVAWCGKTEEEVRLFYISSYRN